MQPVQGFTYMSVKDDESRNGTICKILRRAAISDAEAREFGPAFTVEFGDRHVTTAYAEELRPWYPV